MQTIETQLITKVIVGRKPMLVQLTKIGVDSKFFLDPLNSMVYSFIGGYYKQYGQTPTFKTVRGRFPDFKAMQSSDGVKFLVDELKMSWKLVQFENILSDARIGMEQSPKVAEDKMINDLIRLKQALQNGDLRSSRYADDRWNQYIKRAAREDLVTGIPFGFESYDRVTLGLQSQDFFVILGRQKICAW